MADGIESKTEGVDELVRAMERMAGTDTFGVRVGAKATTGQVKRKSGTSDASRSAGENVLVIRAQAKMGRNVIFLNDDEHRAGQEAWMAGVRQFMETRGDDLDAILRGGEAVGEVIIQAIRDHINNSEGKDGTIKPCLPGTQKQKDREVGPGKPPLVRTGQLLDCLIAEARKI